MILLHCTKIQKCINWPLRVKDVAVTMFFFFPGHGYHQAALYTRRTVQAIPRKTNENP